MIALAVFQFVTSFVMLMAALNANSLGHFWYSVAFLTMSFLFFCNGANNVENI